MAVKRRGGAFALALVLLAGAGACETKPGTQNVPPRQGGDLGAVFQSCDSLCLRPSDCAQAFNDDGICPPGFLCATRFSCHD